jgi:DNA-binding NtrC family response regulator
VLVDGNAVEVVAVDNEPEAEAVLASGTVAILITDINLGNGPDGLQLVSKASSISCRPFVVAMSSVPGLKSLDGYLQEGVVDHFLAKPFTLGELRAILIASGRIALLEQLSRC